MAFCSINNRSVAYRLLGGEALPLMVMAHPLGMTQAVWDDLLPALMARYRILTWDLPGHGNSAAWHRDASHIESADLASEVLALVEQSGAARFHFAGTSIGGTIGQQLLVQAPERLLSATLTNTGAVIGSAENWNTRARRVRTEGLDTLADEIVSRWFAPATCEAQPVLTAGWRIGLARTDAESYALLCEMLGRADFRGRLANSGVRIRLLGGGEDVAAPPATLEALARECGGAPLEILDGIGHVPSVECPTMLGRRLQSEPADGSVDAGDQGASHADGLETRKQVLGDAHVARATAAATSLDEPFQRMITRLAWGELWGNTDLSRVERSMITIAVLAALGRDGELELHLKAARRTGLSEAQLRQALLHVAVYAGVPAANHAFALAKETGWGNRCNGQARE